MNIKNRKSNKNFSCYVKRLGITNMAKNSDDNNNKILDLEGKRPKRASMKPLSKMTE